MERRYQLSGRLIACGTIIVVASLFLVGYQMSLAADDVRDHRAQASNLLRNSSIDRVTLSEWEPPSMWMAWIALIGGFALIGTGIRATFAIPDSAKAGLRDEFE